MSDLLQADGEIIDARSVRFQRVLPGPIERVWAYLTESEKRGTWLAIGETELRVGGTVELVFRNSELTPHKEPVPEKHKHASTSGRVTRCEPPRLLAFTWGGETSNSEVTFELTPRGKDVLLTLTHRRLSSRDGMINVGAGWHTHLDILVDVMNGRTPGPFWSKHAKLAREYEKRIPN